MPIRPRRQPRARLTIALLLPLLLLPILCHGPRFWGHAPATAAVSQTEPAKSGKKHPAQAAIEEAKSLLDGHEETAAMAMLKNVMATYPRSEYLDDAYLLMGAALVAKKEYAEAVTYLELLLTELPESDLAGRARLLLGTAHAKSGNLDQALSVLAAARSLAPDADTQREALQLMGDIQTRKADPLRAIQAWLDELLLAPEEQRAEIRERIRTLVTEKMDRKALVRLKDAYPTEFPGDLALLRLVDLYTARGEDHLAERTLRLFLNRFPTHAHAQSASDRLQSFQTRLKTSSQVLVAVLPLSGRLSQFGTESLYGIRLALEKGKESLGLPSVGLVIKDGEADRIALRSELAETIAEYGPLAVIGPLLSRNLQAVAGLAEDTETPFITPGATLPDVRRLGSYVFSTALTYPSQAHRLADYAMTRLNHRRFCILHPDTTYGQELSRLFSQAVRERGGEIIAVESYKDTDTDFGPQIKRLKAEDLKRGGTTTTKQTNKGLTRVLYTPGFDAIFLPGDYAKIALIAPQLAFYDVSVTLLGGNGWNSPDLLRLGERTIEGGIFVDGFFLDSPTPTIQDFVEQYRLRYQSDPTLFAAQAYDATRLVLEAIRKGATSGKEVREQLANLQDLPALSGPAAFGPGGTLNRKVFVIQIKQGKFVQLE